MNDESLMIFKGILLKNKFHQSLSLPTHPQSDVTASCAVVGKSLKCRRCDSWRGRVQAEPSQRVPADGGVECSINKNGPEGLAWADPHTRTQCEVVEK